MEDYTSFYSDIIKPPLAPPDWLFGLAWGIIYPLIAVAFIYLLYLAFNRRVERSLVWIFVVNMVANFLFTPLLLNYPTFLYGLIDIYIVLGTLAYFEYKIWRHSKIIFVLLLPYLLWGAFATYLMTGIYLLN